MGPECNYSFKDLYKAAFGYEPTQDFLAMFYTIPQEERNAEVKRWSDLAGWGTKERVGTDGVSYIAFCPVWGGK